MALTDGTYIARKKLNRLDQPYPAGSLVPGSAFRDEAQIIEYIRRGRVDVDSTGGGDSGTAFPLITSGESVLFYRSFPYTAPMEMEKFNEVDGGATWDVATYDDFTWLDEAPGGVHASGSTSVTVMLQVPGLYFFRISWATYSFGDMFEVDIDGLQPGNGYISNQVGGPGTTIVVPAYGTPGMAETQVVVGKAQAGSGVTSHPLSQVSITPLMLQTL